MALESGTPVTFRASVCEILRSTDSLPLAAD
jgi:hypothetical protein